MFSPFFVKELGHLQGKVKKKSLSYQREDCVFALYLLSTISDQV